MDYEGNTFEFFLSKYKQDIPHLNAICIMIILLKHRQLLLQCK